MFDAFMSFLIASLNAILGASGMVLAFLYMMGLQHCKNDGRTIMKAIVVVWLMFSLYSFGLLYFNLLKFLEGKLCTNEVHLWFQLILHVALAVAVIYYMWATIRRNPPQVEQMPAGMLHDARQKQ